MARTESNPNLHPFGRDEFSLRGMTAEEQATLSTHERIKAIWPMLLKLAKTHVNFLRQRRVVVTVDDLLQEVVTALLERDHKWQWSRAKYTTFAHKVWCNVRQRQDEIRGVVPAPHNAWSRMQKLKQQQEAGVLKPGQRRTLWSLEIVHETPVTLKEPM